MRFIDLCHPTWFLRSSCPPLMSIVSRNCPGDPSKSRRVAEINNFPETPSARSTVRCQVGWLGESLGWPAATTKKFARKTSFYGVAIQRWPSGRRLGLRCAQPPATRRNTLRTQSAGADCTTSSDRVNRPAACVTRVDQVIWRRELHHLSGAFREIAWVTSASQYRTLLP